MTYTWDPKKSAANLRERGFDFLFATLIFDGLRVENEDTRRDYGERRLQGRATAVSAKSTKAQSEPERPSRGRADLPRLRRETEQEIGATTPAELADLPEGFWDDAEVVVPEPKEPISIRVDRDVLTWFRRTGPGYQTRMNAVLRSYMEAMMRDQDDQG